MSIQAVNVSNLIRTDSVFRKIPLSFNPKLRVSLASIAACVDIIEFTQTRLLSDLEDAGANIDHLEPVRIGVISSVWTLIDNYDMLRQLINGLQTKKPSYFVQFLNYLRDVRLMRNAMDHLGSNVNNIANRRGQFFAPIHGNLGYTFAKQSESGELSLYLCGVAHGLMPAGGVVLMGQMPGDGLKIPIDKLEFHGFGRHLRLDDLYVQLCEFLKAFLPQSEKMISDWAIGVASHHGVPVEDIYNEGGAVISSAVCMVTDRNSERPCADQRQD